MTRNQSLDVLRGIAVLMVIVHHYVRPHEISLLHIGGIGVDLFFVLSGFLISGLLFSELEREGKIVLSRFFIRRGLKIYPAFYFFFFATMPLIWRFSGQRILGEVLFLQSYAPHIWQHTWSLSVEEMFYLSLPPLILLLVKAGKLHFIPVISAALIVGCFIGRVVAWPAFNQTHLRIDALFAGVALRYVYQFHREFFNRWATCAGCGAVLLLLNFVRPHSPLWGSTLFTADLLAFSGLVWWSQIHPLNGRVIAWIGRYSYSIYLWHMLIAMLFWQLRPGADVWGLAADVLSSVLLGIGMALLIENPVLRLRDKFFPSKSPNLAALRQPDGIRSQQAHVVPTRRLALRRTLSRLSSEITPSIFQ